jgi:predicted nucleotide-binding protein
MAFVGLVRDTPGGAWLAADVSGGSAPEAVPDTEKDSESEDAGPEEGTVEPHDHSADAAGESEVVQPKRRPNRIFIGHGRNKTPLDQLSKMLTNLGMPFRIAEEEANVGRPISQKVRETMEDCGAAILIFSADIEYFDKEGAPVWKSSENVANELGAAAVMYDNRIILFKEEGVDLASNYSGIGYITFEKDSLDAKMNDLLKELVALKMLKLSLGDEE